MHTLMVVILRRGLLPRVGRLCLVIAALIGVAAAAPGDAYRPEGRFLAAVDQQVLEDLAQAGEADFLVVLKTKADLTTFESRIGKTLVLPLEMRRAGVPRSLQAVAQQTQASLAAYLDRLGVAYQSYWLVNSLAVRGDQALVIGTSDDEEALAIVSCHRAVATLDLAADGIRIGLLPDVDADAAADDIGRRLIEGGVAIRRFERARASLEERFLEVTS